MNINKIILPILISTMFVGCGGTSSTGTSSNAPVENKENLKSDQPKPIVEENIIFSASFNDNSGILGSGKIINYNNESKSIEITAPFPLAALIPEASGTLPKHKDVTFLTSPSNRTIKLSIPISSYIDLVENPTTLPTGRPLPGVNGGEPPSFGFPLSFIDADTYGYAAFDSFSIFIESGLKLPINLAVPIKSNQDDRQIGKVHWLARSNGENGGLFISVRLPKALSVMLANAQ